MWGNLLRALYPKLAAVSQAGNELFNGFAHSAAYYMVSETIWVNKFINYEELLIWPFFGLQIQAGRHFGLFKLKCFKFVVEP